MSVANTGIPIVSGHPFDRALSALHRRANAKGGCFRLDGQPVSAVNLIREANRVLLVSGYPLIAYPGVAEVQRRDGR